MVRCDNVDDISLCLEQENLTLGKWKFQLTSHVRFNPGLNRLDQKNQNDRIDLINDTFKETTILCDKLETNMSYDKREWKIIWQKLIF